MTVDAPRPSASDRLATAVTSGIARIVDVSASSVFTEPVQVGDRVVIPAAVIDRYGGFGYGAGGDQQGGGDGGGGGGRSEGRPVAVIEAGPDGVRVRPVLDLTKLGLTVLAAALTVWRASRR